MTKVFEFTDFNQAWSFLSRTALLAEKVLYQARIAIGVAAVPGTISTYTSFVYGIDESSSRMVQCIQSCRSNTYHT